MDWKAIAKFAVSHGAAGFVAYQAAIATGATTEVAVGMGLGAAVWGGAMHAIPQAEVTKPLTEPAPEVVFASPAPPPPMTLEQRYGDRADAIYREELGRVTTDRNEGYEAWLLLDAGREDELRKNLKARR